MELASYLNLVDKLAHSKSLLIFVWIVRTLGILLGENVEFELKLVDLLLSLRYFAF